MKPFFKYSGGKSREAKLIASFFQKNFTRIVEPFCGSCAISFHLERPALVADSRDDIINVLKVVQNPQTYIILQKRIDMLKKITDKIELEKTFYHWRDKMWKTENILDKAFRFLVIRQLVFSGMDRINSSGKENAPFGWYKKFNCRLGIEHHNILKNWEIVYQSFEETLKTVIDDDFVFVDPPYLTRKGYINNFSENQHIELLRILDELKATWLIVHCDHPLYRKFSKKYNVFQNSFCYSQNFKGRTNLGSRVNHLYISNCQFSISLRKENVV